MTLEEVKDNLARCFREMDEGVAYYFAIVDAMSGAYVGGISLDLIDRTTGVANTGYWVRTSRTGRGIATAAVQLVPEYAFRRVGLKRVEILVALENAASNRVAQKAGAAYQGIVPLGLHRGLVQLRHESRLYWLEPAAL